MAKSNIGLWLIAIVAVLIIGMMAQKQYELFAILPTGEYRANSDCTFITNIEEGSNYREKYGYIVADGDGDGNIDIYVYNGYSSYNCLAENIIGTTLEGYNICTRPGYDPLTRVYIRVGIYGIIFVTYGSYYDEILPIAQEDITMCTTPCPVSDQTVCTACEKTIEALNAPAFTCTSIELVACMNNLINYYPSEFERLTEGTGGNWHCTSDVDLCDVPDYLNNVGIAVTPPHAEFGETITYHPLTEIPGDLSTIPETSITVKAEIKRNGVDYTSVTSNTIYSSQAPMYLDDDDFGSTSDTMPNQDLQIGIDFYVYLTRGSEDSTTCSGNDAGWLYLDTVNIIVDLEQEDCNTNADTNCNGIVTFQELNTYAIEWVNNQVSFNDLITSANAWVSN